MPSAEITRALLDHYGRHRRDLPWRDTADPYAIWVSEVMLQQTRVEAAAPYWERWMRRFPTVAALADAPLDDVLRAWEGLGYYSRPRNLHRAARLVCERHGGAVPSDPARLRELPGVGQYTAGAVASIAYGVPVPAVDGNVRRVLARLHDLERPGARRLAELAAALVPEDRPGDFNQAIMELGATICSPRSPRCDRCPVASWCRARELGVQESRPRPAERRAIPEETVATAVVGRDDGRVLIVRRPDTGLLAGLWEFPGDDGPPWVARLVADATVVAELEPVRHAFSHKAVRYTPTLYRSVRSAVRPPPPSTWASLDSLDRFAMPSAQRRIAASARAAWAASGQ